MPDPTDTANAVLTQDNDAPGDAEVLQLVRVNVTNAGLEPPGAAMNGTRFTLPSTDWKFHQDTAAATTKHVGPSGWNIGVGTTPSGRGYLEFRKPGAGGAAAIPVGGTAAHFTLAIVKVPDLQSPPASDPQLYVWAYGAEGAFDDPPEDIPLGGCETNTQADVDGDQCARFSVPIRLLGIRGVRVTGPAGAQDGQVSPGQDVTFAINVSYYEDLEDARYRLFVGPHVAANGDDAKVVTSEITHTKFSASAEPDNNKTVNVTFIFSDTLGARTIVFGFESIEAPAGYGGVTFTLPMEVQAKPKMNDTWTNITIATGLPRNLTARIDMGSAVNRATTVDVTLVNNGTAPVEGIVATLRMLDAAGTDQSSKFFVNSTSPNYNNVTRVWTIPSVAATGLATGGSGTTLVNTSAGAFTGVAAGMRLSVVAGKGAGQERYILGVAATTLTVNTTWDEVPDTTSQYQVHRVFGKQDTNPLLANSFTVAPVLCNTVECSAAPGDGLYDFTLDISYFDNNQRDASSTAVTERRSAAQLIRMDSTPPSVTRIAPGSTPAFVEFQRGGANQFRFELGVTDATVLDGSQVLFKVLDSTRRINTAGTACVGPEDVTATTNQCVLEADLKFTEQGNNFNITYDFARRDRLGLMNVYAPVTDKAGNFRNFSLDPWDIRDMKKPEFTSAVTVSPSSAEVLLGQSLTFTVGIKDEYGLKDPLVGSGDAVDIYLKASHANNGSAVAAADKLGSGGTNDVVDIPAILGGGKGIRYSGIDDCTGGACTNAPVTGNGTWAMTVRFPASGTYNITILAADASASLNRANTSQIQVRVKPAFSFTYSTGDAEEHILTTSGSQAPGEAANFTGLDLHNQGSIGDDFRFGCRMLPETTAARAARCRVLEPERLEAVSDADITVTIYNATNHQAVNLTTGTHVGPNTHGAFYAHVKPTAAARPGEVVRVELFAEPLSLLGNATVRARFTVVEGIGVTHVLETGNSTLGSAASPRVIRMTQPFVLPLKLRNPGNVNTTYVLSSAANDTLAGWGVDFSSTDARWDDAANRIRLPPAGTEGGLNGTTDLFVTLTAPETSAGQARQVTLTATTDTDLTTEDAMSVTLHVNSRLPSVRVDQFNVTAFSETAGQTCSNSTVTENATCIYVASGRTNVKFSAHVTSSQNVPGSGAGIIVAQANVTVPCATSCVNNGVHVVPLLLEQADAGQPDTFAGRNGTYVGYLNITDFVGRLHARIFAVEQPIGDQFTSAERRFEVTANPLGVAPALSDLEVFENGLKKEKVGNRYAVTFGANITIKVNMTDANNTGSATLLTKRRTTDADGNTIFVAVGAALPMTRTAGTDLLTRQTTSTYQVVWRQGGTLLANGGEFLLDFDAFNAMQQRVGTGAVSSFINLTVPAPSSPSPPSDTTPPRTVASTTGVAGLEGWWRSAVDVTFAAMDNGSGVAVTRVRLDDGPLLSTSSLRIEADGLHQVAFFSVDAVGNQEVPQVLTVGIDATPAATAARLSGIQGDAGWWRSAVLVALDAHDATSGVAATSFALDGGALLQGSGILVAQDGPHEVRWSSADRAGNVEDVREVAFRIDATPPRTTADLHGTQGEEGWWTSAVDVVLRADDPESGVSSLRFSVDGFPFQEGDRVVVAADGVHTVRYAATDAAGNAEAEHLLVLRVDRTQPAVSLTDPENGRLYIDDAALPVEESLPRTIVIGSKSVRGTAQDVTSGLARVEFFVDGVLRGVDGEAPFVFEWNAGSEPVGEHVLALRAVDRAGNRATDERTVTSIPTTEEGLLALRANCEAVLSPALCRPLPARPPDLPLPPIQGCGDLLAQPLCDAAAGLLAVAPPPPGPPDLLAACREVLAAAWCEQLLGREVALPV